MKIIFVRNASGEEVVLPGWYLGICGVLTSLFVGVLGYECYLGFFEQYWSFPLQLIVTLLGILLFLAVESIPGISMQFMKDQQKEEANEE